MWCWLEVSLGGLLCGGCFVRVVMWWLLWGGCYEVVGGVTVVVVHS